MLNKKQNDIAARLKEIQMSVTGKIGDNLEMRVKYDTESQFEFDNTMNLRYQGKEDDIIQKIPSPWTLENRSRVMIMLKRTQDQ